MADHYSDGFRNGHADALLGLEASVIALSSHVPGYARGYRAGYAEMCLEQYQRTLAAYRQARRENGVTA